jgi:hypothetical protein
VEKLEQDDGGYLATVVWLASMGRAAVAEIILRERISAPRPIVDRAEPHRAKAGEDKGGEIEVRPCPSRRNFEKSRIIR